MTVTINGDGTITPKTAVQPAGSILQVAHKYLTSTGQLESGGAINELTTDARIAFTPEQSSSKLIFEVYAPFFHPNSANLQYAYIYDVTNSAGVNLPAASSSRVRCHWVNRNGPVDANDADLMNFKIIADASNTNARTYTIYHGSEGAISQFYRSSLDGNGAVYPIVFTITEVSA